MLKKRWNQNIENQQLKEEAIWSTLQPFCWRLKDDGDVVRRSNGVRQEEAFLAEEKKKKMELAESEKKKKKGRGEEKRNSLEVIDDEDEEDENDEDEDADENEEGKKHGNEGDLNPS